MMNLLQDSTTQAQRDSATTATVPMAEMRTPQNVGYLQAVYVEFALIFGGYILLSFRRDSSIRKRQQRFRRGR
ncbi:MAG: hypothetical protein ABJC26_19040 [Gemmatimonadaceae bacterium]